MLRSWLENHGIVKSPAQAKRDDLLKIVKDNYYGASDKVWDTWNDAEIKAYLIKNKLADKKQVADLKRDQLENRLEEKYTSLKDNYLVGWSDSEMRQVRISTAALFDDWLIWHYL